MINTAKGIQAFGQSIQMLSNGLQSMNQGINRITQVIEKVLDTIRGFARIYNRATSSFARLIVTIAPFATNEAKEIAKPNQT